MTTLMNSKNTHRKFAFYEAVKTRYKGHVGVFFNSHHFTIFNRVPYTAHWMYDAFWSDCLYFPMKFFILVAIKKAGK